MRSFGRFRSQQEIDRRLNNLPVPEKENRRELCKQLLTVCQVDFLTCSAAVYDHLLQLCM